MIVVERKTKKEYKCEESKILKFLYNNFIGRVILKLLINKLVANVVAAFMNSSLSNFMKNRKIKKYNIDMTLFEDKKYNSYNAFFTRKFKVINKNVDKKYFISPCESKLMILDVKKDTEFKVKGSTYSLNSIINDKISKEYVGGYALIFRLDVNNYHRYCYIDNGKRTKYKHIEGLLHTVQPLVYDKVKVFHQNSREWCVLKTENFGDVIQVEVGALNVGKINNHKEKTFSKLDEKGYFEFGGSTVILFVKKDQVIFDEDILTNSKNGKETMVNYGEIIGKKQ